MDLQGRLIAISREVLKANQNSTSFLQSKETKNKPPLTKLRKRCRGCEAIRNFFFR